MNLKAVAYAILHPKIGKSKRRENDQAVWLSILALIAAVELGHSPFCPVLRRWIGVGTNAKRRKALSVLFVTVLGWFGLHILTLP